MSIKAFDQNNIAPLVTEFHHLMDAGLLEDARATLGEIQKVIRTADTAFPKEKKYITLLEKGQSDRWEQLQRPALEPITAKTAHPEMMKEMAPVGIRNSGGNDCWANAILQFLANTLGKKVLANGKCKTLIVELQKLYDAQINAKEVSSVNSQALRKELMPKSGQRQIDFTEALESVLDRIGFEFEIKQRTLSLEDELLEKQTSSSRMLQTGIASSTQFNDLLRCIFTAHIEYNEQPMKKTIQFKLSPDHLILQAERHPDPQAELLGVPEQFELPPETTCYNERGVHYELTSCVIHSGKDNGGHYTILTKKPDGWYFVNDSRVRKLGEGEVDGFLKRGYVFHFRKYTVEVPALQAPPVEIEKPSRSCSSRLIDSIWSAAMPMFALASYPIGWIKALRK